MASALAFMAASLEASDFIRMWRAMIALGEAEFVLLGGVFLAQVRVCRLDARADLRGIEDNDAEAAFFGHGERRLVGICSTP